ncbi:MAG: HlyD family efflux transporter periplasmic adaptor subunit, partial [Planctomycetota bacterium]
MPSVSRFVASAILLACVVTGCDNAVRESEVSVKRPRPVVTRALVNRASPSSAFVAASVASWKTEEIGFEVGGRVEWVTEKNATIEGRVTSPQGQLLVPGAPIARLDPESYQLDFEIAKAELSRAEQQVVATTISLEKTIPAQLRAAQSDQRLAEIEVSRSRRLIQTNAISQSELDADEAELATAVSQVEQLVAQLRSTEADLVADRLGVEQAKQSLRDAERNLENCTLYSSFRGQIADVAVVPGSVVSSGTPIATIQMMDPIKIEFEVSASDSRLLAREQELPFVATDENGAKQRLRGLIYQIDPVADPSTRTFTVTLLAMNEEVRTSTAGGAESLAVIEKAWRTDLEFLPGSQPGSNFVLAESIESDGQGNYVWRIDGYKQGEMLPENRQFKVSKLPVRPVGQPIPFLGEFLFQRVEVADPSYD